MYLLYIYFYKTLKQDVKISEKNAVSSLVRRLLYIVYGLQTFFFAVARTGAFVFASCRIEVVAYRQGDTSAVQIVVDIKACIVDFMQRSVPVGTEYVVSFGGGCDAGISG